MNHINQFIIEISSDLDYEDLVANVLYEEETVAIVSQEQGLDKLEIEIFSPGDKEPWKFFFHDFLNALLFAKKRLIQMQKLPEE